MLHDIADGISYVLANRKELGEAARKKVAEAYSEEYIAKKYNDVYCGLIY